MDLPSPRGGSRSRWQRILLGGVFLALAAGGDLGVPADGAAGPPAGHNRLLGGTWQHAPVVDDDCTVCHRLHADGAGPRLREAVPALCRRCHYDQAAQEVVHAPVAQGACLQCHATHSSDHRPLLVLPVPALCLTCHPQASGHVSRGHRCAACHWAHSADTAALLKDENARGCDRCHRDKRKGVALHKPVEDGDCLICHFTRHDRRQQGPHRLRASYPKGSLSPYAPGLYALCNRCHDEALYADLAYRETGFRTAAENLHARHVRGGATCTGCHDVHASDLPARLVRWVRTPESAPAALGFVRSDRGGACGPACHPAASYRRPGPAKATRNGP